MPMRRREPKYTFSRTRRRNAPPERVDPLARVDAPPLLRRLHDHAMGRRALTTVQLRALHILLDKVLPDLAARKAPGSGRDEAAILDYAAYRERADWHAWHRARLADTPERRAKVAIARGAEHDLPGNAG